ncbi:DUF7260 family protein [Halobellus sp. EA9]|uniref:DUF7260 family protein n=1 Tax=Halobellus sp. EA9 TaxID=3421647 RepID=UPI003EBAA581
MPDIAAAVEDLTAARRRVRDEHRATEKQRRGFEQFRRVVVETDPVSVGGAERALSAGEATAAAATTDDRCRRVRSAFEEQVAPHVDGEAAADVRTALASELSAEVAVALASEGGGNRFTEPLQRAILTHVEQRLAESDVMLRTLDRERASLDDAVETLKSVRASLPAADAATVILADDETLWKRRRRIESLEADLEAAIEARQSTLDSVTASEVKAGIGHDTVVEYLFGDRETTYPALDALLRGVRECQRRRDRFDEALDDEASGH